MPLFDDADYSSGGGGLLGGGGGWLSNKMMNPLVLGGLALAGGATPQEGFGNMSGALFKAGVYQRAQQKEREAQGALAGALQASNLPPNYARALALNPQAAPMLTPKIEMVEDPITGMKKPQLIHPLTGAMMNPQAGNATPAMGAGQPGAASGPDNGSINTAAYEALLQNPESLQGQEYIDALQKVAPGQSNMVKGMLEGRLPVPSGFAMKSPFWQNILKHAANAEPNFDLTTWQGRQKGVRDWMSGTDAETVRRLNQALLHTSELPETMGKLPSTPVPLLNKLINTVQSEGQGQGQVKEFNLNAHAVADELARIWKGANLSDTEIRKWEENLTPDMSKEQQRAVMRKLMNLVDDGMVALEDKRKAAVGPMRASKMGPLLSPKGSQAMRGVRDWLGGGEAPPKEGGQPVGQADTVSRDRARAAIARGAPREEVIKRLRANGIDATGL